MPKFKYKTSFTSELFAADQNNLESFISQASLEPLSSLIPGNIDLEKNVDLLAVAFNAAVVNKFNRNGDGIDSKTALAIKDYFVHKPTNIEHNKNKVVGHIINSSLSDFKTNEILEDLESIEGSYEPFNIALSSVIYRMVNPAFADLVEQSVDEDSEYNNVVSASWELGFTDYEIVVGGDDLRSAEVIKPNHRDEFSSYLKANGGEGKLDDGTPVNRLVVGDVYPLGVGFTSNPAADVEGIYVGVSAKKESSLKKNISQNEKKDVIENEQPNKIMEQLIEKLTNVLESSNSTKKFSEEVLANISQVVHDAIIEKNTEWQSERETVNSEKTQMEEAAKEQQEKIESFETKLASTMEELETVKSEVASRDAADLFNSRMEKIETEYDLDTEDRKFLAQEVKSLASAEETFSEYQEKLSVIWKHKSLSFKEEQEKLFNEKVEAEIQKRLAADEPAEAEEATEEEVVDEAVANAEEEEESVPNNNEDASKEPQTLIQKFQNAFKEEDLVDVQL